MILHILKGYKDASITILTSSLAMCVRIQVLTIFLLYTISGYKTNTSCNTDVKNIARLAYHRLVSQCHLHSARLGDGIKMTRL